LWAFKTSKKNLEVRSGSISPLTKPVKRAQTTRKRKNVKTKAMSVTMRRTTAKMIRQRMSQTSSKTMLRTTQSRRPSKVSCLRSL